MIIHLKKGLEAAKLEALGARLKASIISTPEKEILITSSAIKELPLAEFSNGIKADKWVLDTFVFPNDMQLASRDYRNQTREISIGKNKIGGDSQNTLMITGPCSVESEAQIRQAAELCVELGISALRGGCFKPRTSPYTFQGLGLEGLKLLAKMRNEYGLSIVTEVRDATHVEDVIEYADIIQIGAKSMYDHGILKRCGKARKPILLKRGFGTTLQEFVQAAEFILSGGNEDVMLCERGIRTFETKTRFTLDLCGVAYLKEHTNLPVVLDPSHAMGYAYGVPDLTRACMAMGVDGLLIESHPTPKKAWSDASQQLDFDELRDLHKSLASIGKAVGRTLK